MMNNNQWNNVRALIVQLTPNSDVYQVLTVAGEVQKLEHWFDRKRALKMVADKLGVDVDLIERLSAGVKSDAEQ